MVGSIVVVKEILLEIDFLEEMRPLTSNKVSIGVASIYDYVGGGGKTQITCNYVIRIFQKDKLFMGQRSRRMEDQKACPRLVRNQIFAKAVTKS